jgi:hypothetical protein
MRALSRFASGFVSVGPAVHPGAERVNQEVVMDPRTQAIVVLVAALAAGAVLHKVAGAQAAALGLSALELALLSAGVGALATRKLA